MSLINAASLDTAQTKFVADVCIVGAGAAGIYLGVRLAKMGHDVIILEAGDRVCEDGVSFDFETIFEKGRYRAAHEGRAFGLGGTTSSWGGVLVPYTEYDLRTGTDASFDPWRHIVNVVKEHGESVLETLKITPPLNSAALAERHLAGRLDTLQDRGLDLQIAQYLPFRRKNFATLLHDNKSSTADPTVLMNAVAKKWTLDSGDGGKVNVASVEALCGNRTVTVAATSFVVAAGALESARILLEIERETGQQPFPETAAIGHYLGDHLSCSVATVMPTSQEHAARLFRPRFADGRMYYFRLLERNAPMDAPRSFAHFIFEDESAGFGLAKKMLGAVQKRTLPDLSMGEAIAGVKGLAALGWNRWIRSQLYIPKGTSARLQLDIEQAPNYDNHLRLSDREKDAWGRFTPIIDWGIKTEDYETIRNTAHRLLSKWPGAKNQFPELEPVLNTDAERKPHDAYHPVGVCHLGKGSEAVVEPNLRVRGTTNLSVLSTAVFPSAGTANPTFSMLCFGEMLSDRMHGEVVNARRRCAV